MTTNMGMTDRVIRAIIGAVLLVLAFATLTGAWAWIAGIVGAVLLVTSAMGHCPAYTPFGLNTCRRT
jgi:general stress protein CsbA